MSMQCVGIKINEPKILDFSQDIQQEGIRLFVYKYAFLLNFLTKIIFFPINKCC